MWGEKLQNKKKGLFFWFDPWIFTCVTLAAMIGFAVIASSTKSMASPRFLIIQGTAFIMGLFAIIALIKLDYDYIGQLSPYIFGINILLLIAVLIIGQGDELGTKGWIRFGAVGIQPAELVKIGFIITFAKHVDSVNENINDPKNVLMLLLHGGVFIGLILLQPDAGTAMVFAVIILGMLFIAGLSLRYFAVAGGAFAIAAPILWFFILEDYQKSRITSFFNPELDPLGTGYHVLQSKIAIGSGKILGRGLGSGIQTQYGYLPEKQTDFIFAVIGEELGLWGTLIVVALLIAIIVRCFVISMSARDKFGQLLCAGVAFMLLFHVFENIGMCLGLFPVTGIPLPFISYGGSNMLASMLAIALVLNVAKRKKRTGYQL